MSSAFLYFDDTSSVFSYSNNWFHNTDLSGFLAHGVFNDTLFSTTTIGSTVTVEFIASQIVIIGATIAPPNAPKNSGPITSYVVDNSQNSAFLFQANPENATGVTFFNSGPLTSGKHTLKITVLGISDGIPFLLDAALVGQPETATPSTAVWVTTVFATGTSAPTSILSNGTTSANLSDSKSLPVGAIVGGVVGGVALIVGAALAFFFLYYRRKRQDYNYYGFSRDLADSEKDRVQSSMSVPPSANEGRFSTQYQQYEPFLSPASPSLYTDATPSLASPGVPPTVTPHTSMYSASALGPHTSMYSTSALGPHTSIYSVVPPGAAGAGAVALAALAAPHSYPPPAGSVTSSSTSGAGRALSVVNDTGDVGTAAAAAGAAGAAALTPAQLKAAEAAGEKKDGLHPDQPVQFHADSGVRFDGEGNPVLPSGSGAASGSGSGSGSHEPEPIDVPPEYTEI